MPCRLLLPALSCLADREGRLDDNPQAILAFAFPYDEVNVDEILQTLYLAGHIVRYSIDGVPYIQVVRFLAEQKNIHYREAQSRIPSHQDGGVLRKHVIESEAPPQAKPRAKPQAPPQAEPQPSLNRGSKDVDVNVKVNGTTNTKRDKSSTYLAATERGKREPDELSPIVSRLQKIFDERLEGKYGPHQFPWAVAGLKFRSLLAKKIPEEEIIRRMENYFASTEKFIEDNGHSVTVFIDMKFNALAGGPIGRFGNNAGNVVAGHAAPVPGKYAALTQRTDKGP